MTPDLSPPAPGPLRFFLRFFVRFFMPLGAVAIFASMLAACTSTLDTSNPQQVNFSGQWRLVPELSDAPPQFAPNNDGARSTNRRRDDHLGSLRPVVRARAMTIEQTGSSMGIDYAGFPYRDVSWGKRTRGTFEVTAGWQDNALQIRSKRGRMILTEVYRLSSDQQQLELTVSFRGGSQNGRNFRRIFARRR